MKIMTRMTVSTCFAHTKKERAGKNLSSGLYGKQEPGL